MPLIGEEKRDYQRRWLKRRRQEFIKSQGGICRACGRTDRLEIDHIDPATKLSHRVFSWATDRREAELAKCQVLCKRCHGIKGRGKNSRITRENSRDLPEAFCVQIA